MTLPGWLARPVDIGWRALRLFVHANGLSWSAALGLYLFLSVPPLMVASAFIASFFVAEFEAASFVLVQAAKFVPAESDLLQSILVREDPIATTAGLVSLAFLLVGGSRTFAALASAINRVWHLTEQLGFGKTQLIRVGLLALSLALLALTGAAEAAIGALDVSGASAGQVWLLEWQVLPSVVLAVFLFVTYRVLPETHVDWRHAALGAVVATIGVRVSQAVMGMMAEAGSFERPFGGLAGVGLMATWALVVGIAVLLGASLVAVLGGHDRDEDPGAHHHGEEAAGHEERPSQERASHVAFDAARRSGAPRSRS